MAKNYSKITSQIKSLKERKQFDTLWDIKPSLVRINILLKDVTKSDEYLKQVYLKYIVVNLVSILESFTRSFVKRLIDHGEPYIDNSKNFFGEKIKMDFDPFRYIQKKEFTLGEFVAHQISCSNVEDVMSSFKNVLGENLIDFFDKIDIPDQRPTFKQRVKAYRKNDLRAIQRIFELRHIICHENSFSLEVDEKEVRIGYGSITSLLNICGDAVQHIVNPTFFLSFKEQISLHKTFLESQKSTMNTLIAKINNEPQTAWDEQIDLSLFNESQCLWEKFAIKHSEVMSSVILNVPEYNVNMLSKTELELMYLEELGFLYEERIEDLKSDFNL